MPSPAAHGFAGLALAHVALRNGFVRGGWGLWLGALAFAANAPDLDFLPGILIGEPNQFHHGPTHTLIGVGAFAMLAGGFARVAGLAEPRRFAALMGLAYFSHLLLDLVTVETYRPSGMTLLWPFSGDPVRLPIHVFLDIRRDEATGGFLPSLFHWHNARAVAWELAVVGGLWAVYRAVSSVAMIVSRSARESTPAE